MLDGQLEAVLQGQLADLDWRVRLRQRQTRSPGQGGQDSEESHGREDWVICFNPSNKQAAWLTTRGGSVLGWSRGTTGRRRPPAVWPSQVERAPQAGELRGRP